MAPPVAKGKARSSAKENAQPPVRSGKPEQQQTPESDNEEEPPLTAHDVPEFASVAEATKAYETLLTSHRQLQRLRQTEPERLMKDFVRTAERQRAASDDIVRGLEEQASALQRQVAEAQQQRAAAEAQLETAQQQLTATQAQVRELSAAAAKAELAAIDDYKAKLAFYQRLTGVSCTMQTLPQKKSKVAQPQREVTIEHMGKNGHLSYKLIERTDDQVDYVFVSKQLNPNVDLPDYLSEEIEFDKEQLSAFFWQILDVLSKEQP